jgi:hypothetical protein
VGDLALLILPFCVGWCGGGKSKCAKCVEGKLLFKMCGGKNFKNISVGLSVGKLVWSVSNYSEIVYRDKVGREVV